MGQTATNVISIALDEAFLKIVQTKGSGRSARVMKTFIKSIIGVDSDTLPKTIHASLSGFAVKSSNVHYVLPSSSVTIKNLDVPSTNEEEIRSIVNLQAGRYTPFSRDEIQVSYITLGKVKDDQTKVLLVIANKQVLKEKLAIFEKARVRIQRVLFASEAIARYYADVYDIRGNNVPTGLVSLGYQTTDFLVISKGLVVTSRSIPVGKTQLTVKGETAELDLCEELSKTIELYQNEDIDVLPEAYVMTSEDTLTQSLGKKLHEKYAWKINTKDYLNEIKMGRGDIKKLTNQFSECTLLDVLASAIMEANLEINLMPDEFQLQKSIEDQSSQVLRALVSAGIIFVFVFFLLGTKWFFLNAYLTRLDEEFKSNHGEVQRLDHMAAQTRSIQSFLSSRMMSLDVISALYDYLPQSVYLTGVTMDAQGQITIQGIAEAASEVFNLGTTLKESDYFKSVKIKSTSSKKDRGRDVSAFEILLGLDEESVVGESEQDNIEE